MNDNKRQTGRTGRMLEDARRLSEEGRAVYVIAVNMRHARDLSLRFGENPNGVKFESLSTVSTLDWKTMRSPGMHPNAEILVDHYAIESEFQKMLEMLTRYDEQKPNPES